MAMVVNPITVQRGLKTIFFQAYQVAAAVWQMIATEVPSDAPEEDYGWLGSAPTMREWTDERVPKGLIDHEYTIKNKDWEASIALNRNAVDDGRYGQIRVRIQDLARRAKVHPNGLVIGLLVDGDSNLCYDGKAFFASDHADPGAEYTDGQANALTYDCSDHTAPTLAELKAAFDSAVKALLEFKDDRGEFAHEDDSGLAVVCNTHLRTAFRELFGADRIGDTTNVLKDAAKLIPTARYTHTDRFALLKVDGALKPLIFQNRQNVRLASTATAQQVNAAGFVVQDVEQFMRKHVFYGVDARYNVGYGDWRQALEVTLT